MAPDEQQTAPARRADARLRLAAAQKSRGGTAWYLLHVNRPLGGRVAVLAHGMGATPDQVSAVSAALSLAGIALVALLRPSPWLGVLVAVLLLAGYAVDSADGQLARVRGGGSPQGEWLDHSIDCVKNNLLHVAVLVSAYRFFDVARGWLLVPIGFLVVHNVTQFSYMLRDQLLRPIPKELRGLEVGEGSTLKELVRQPIDYASIALAFVLLGWPRAFVVAYTLLFAYAALFALRAVPRARTTVARAHAASLDAAREAAPSRGPGRQRRRVGADSARGR